MLPSCWSSPMFWLFYNLDECALPAVELDNIIWFSTFSRMPGFLWHSSKWTQQFGHFLQYTSGLEVLVCSLNTDLNYVITVLQLGPPLLQPLSKVVVTFRGKMWQLFGFILIDRYITLAVLFPGPEALCLIFQQNAKTSRISSWASCALELFVLSLYLWLICYLLGS